MQMEDGATAGSSTHFYSLWYDPAWGLKQLPGQSAGLAVTLLSFFPCHSHLMSSPYETKHHILVGIFSPKSRNPIDRHSHILHNAFVQSGFILSSWNSLQLPPPIQPANKRKAIDTHTFTHSFMHTQADPGKPRQRPWHWCPLQTCCPIIALEGKQSLQGQRAHASSSGLHYYEEVFPQKDEVSNNTTMWVWVDLCVNPRAPCLPAPVSHCCDLGCFRLGWYCFGERRWKGKKKETKTNKPKKICNQRLGFNLRLLEMFHTQITCCCQQCFHHLSFALTAAWVGQLPIPQSPRLIRTVWGFVFISGCLFNECGHLRFMGSGGECVEEKLLFLSSTISSYHDASDWWSCASH